MGLPGPDVHVRSVEFSSTGLVTSVDADYLGIKGPPSSIVRSQLNKALEAAFGKGEGVNGQTVNGLLNTMSNNQTGVCVKITTGPVTN